MYSPVKTFTPTTSSTSTCLQAHIRAEPTALYSGVRPHIRPLRWDQETLPDSPRDGHNR
jgi:hypothetical protein